MGRHNPRQQLYPKNPGTGPPILNHPQAQVTSGRKMKSRSRFKLPTIFLEGPDNEIGYRLANFNADFPDFAKGTLHVFAFEDFPN